MTDKGIIRVVKCPWSRNLALLRLFRVNCFDEETLVATSSPVTKVAAAAIAQLSAGPLAVKLDVEALAAVLGTPGKTAWASFTAHEPSVAALKACLQHDVRRARAALGVITLSMDSNIVNDVRAVLDVVHPQLMLGTVTAFVTTFDAQLNDEVKVELLLLGM